MTYIVEDLWRVSYTVETNSSIKSRSWKTFIVRYISFSCIVLSTQSCNWAWGCSRWQDSLSLFLAAVIHKTARLGECMPGNSRVKTFWTSTLLLLVLVFRHPGTYPKKPGGVFWVHPPKKNHPKNPHFYFNLILVYTFYATNNAIFYCF